MAPDNFIGKNRMEATNQDLYPLQEVSPGSFIYAIDNALSQTDCDEMVTRFEANEDQQYPGRIGVNQQHEASVKKSTDLLISGKENWKDLDLILVGSLQKALKSVSAIHPFFRSNQFRDMGYNLQRTLPGEYYHWHVDYGPGEDMSQRALVALWYLNDVPGPGGTTDFTFQNISVQPQAGRLVLFPPYWTHVHRNATLEKGVKYIATTWVCMV